MLKVTVLSGKVSEIIIMTSCLKTLVRRNETEVAFVSQTLLKVTMSFGLSYKHGLAELFTELSKSSLIA
jgi:hypothetical protein